MHEPNIIASKIYNTMMHTYPFEPLLQVCSQELLGQDIIYTSLKLNTSP